MKLTMRAKVLGRKITLISTAFVLAVSTLTAAGPFVAPGNVGAVSGDILYVNGTTGVDNGSCVVATPCKTIQHAVTTAAAGSQVRVEAGDYNENVTVTKKVYLKGVNRTNSKINGWVKFSAGSAGSTLHDFTITTNDSQYSVYVTASNVTIHSNTLFQTISPSVSAKAIYAGDADIDGLKITNNKIRLVESSKGAYGILINKKNFTNLQITGNEIITLRGGWTHAIGLEGNTPGAVVTGNTISGLTARNAGEVPHPVFFQDNVGASSVALNSTYEGKAVVNQQSPVYVNDSWAGAVTGGVVLTSTDNTYRIFGQNAFATLADALQAAPVNGTVVLDSDLTVTAQPTVVKPLTIEGNDRTITGNYTRTSGSNNSVLSIQSSNVVVKNLTTNAGPASQMLHGINIYQVQGITLSNITALNGRSGVNVNGSTVAIDGIKTSGNAWNGINVDKTGAQLTISGVNQHSSEKPAIYVDDKAVGSVVDVSGKYAIVENPADTNNHPNDRAYYLKMATPTLSFPANNGYTTSNNFYFKWNSVASAVKYEFQNSLTGAAVNGVLTTVNYSASTKDATPQLYSSGAADGSVRYWQVRAVDANGAKSDWSEIWKMTIDMTAPAAPVLKLPANNAVVTGSPKQEWSHPNQSDVHSFVYESYSDQAGTKPIMAATELTGLSRKVGGTQNITFWWRVGAKDTAGNISWSALSKMTVDNKAPEIVLNNLGTTPVRETVTVTGSVDDVALSHYDLSLYPASVNLADGKPHNDSRIEISGTDWKKAGTVYGGPNSVSLSRALDTTKLDPGVYQIRLAAKDKFDKVTVQYFSFTVDNDAPSVSLDANESSTNTPTLTGTVGDPTATVTVDVDGALYDATVSEDRWSVTLPQYADGTYWVVVTARDEAGNTKTASGSLVIRTTTGDSEGENGGDRDQDRSGELQGQRTTATVTPSTPAIVSPVGNFAAILGDSTAIPAATADDDDDVKGASTLENVAKALDADNTDGKALGLAWYWWLLIVAAAAVVVWWLAAAIRRRGEEQA